MLQRASTEKHSHTKEDMECVQELLHDEELEDLLHFASALREYDRGS